MSRNRTRATFDHPPARRPHKRKGRAALKRRRESAAERRAR